MAPKITEHGALARAEKRYNEVKTVVNEFKNTPKNEEKAGGWFSKGVIGIAYENAPRVKAAAEKAVEIHKENMKPVVDALKGQKGLVQTFDKQHGLVQDVAPHAWGVTRVIDEMQ